MDEAILEQYAEKLSHYMKIPIIVIVVVSALMAIAFILVCRFKLLKETYIYFALGCIALIAAYFLVVFPIQWDIKEKSYVSYSGDFFVEDHYYTNGGSSPYIVIKCQNETKAVKYKISGDFDFIKSNTNYSGKFVYGKRSKAIVDISVE